MPAAICPQAPDPSRARPRVGCMGAVGLAGFGSVLDRAGGGRSCGGGGRWHFATVTSRTDSYPHRQTRQDKRADPKPSFRSTATAHRPTARSPRLGASRLLPQPGDSRARWASGGSRTYRTPAPKRCRTTRGGGLLGGHACRSRNRLQARRLSGTGRGGSRLAGWIRCGHEVPSGLSRKVLLVGCTPPPTAHNAADLPERRVFPASDSVAPMLARAGFQRTR